MIETLREAGHVRRMTLPTNTNATEEAPETLELVGPVPMPIQLGETELLGRWYVAAPTALARESALHAAHLSVLAFGELAGSAAPLVRIHSTCFTGDVLGSMRCDCGPQLHAALRRISSAESGGLLVYMAGHEGRGIGLWSKATAYLLQDQGLDTYEANRALGFKDDARDYRQAVAVIRQLLGERPFELLTNNPDKVAQLRSLGLHQAVQAGHFAGVGAHNRRYLEAKRAHGHKISEAALASD